MVTLDTSFKRHDCKGQQKSEGELEILNYRWAGFKQWAIKNLIYKPT